MRYTFVFNERYETLQAFGSLVAKTLQKVGQGHEGGRAWRNGRSS